MSEYFPNYVRNMVFRKCTLENGIKCPQHDGRFVNYVPKDVKSNKNHIQLSMKLPRHYVKNDGENVFKKITKQPRIMSQPTQPVDQEFQPSLILVPARPNLSQSAFKTFVRILNRTVPYRGI